MCRLMAYIGPPALIADVVLWPDRSIIKQSYDARCASIPVIGYSTISGPSCSQNIAAICFTDAVHPLQYVLRSA